VKFSPQVALFLLPENKKALFFDIFKKTRYFDRFGGEDFNYYVKFSKIALETNQK